MPRLVLIINGIEDMVHENFEWIEVGFLSVRLGRVLWGLLVDDAESTILVLLWEGRLRLRFSLLSSPGRAIDCSPGHILDLDVFLGPREDLLYLSDFVLHQVLVKRVSDLQPTDE